MKDSDRAMLALQRYRRANPEQRIGQAVYNIAREVSGEHCPPTSAVFSMPDAALADAVTERLAPGEPLEALGEWLKAELRREPQRRPFGRAGGVEHGTTERGFVIYQFVDRYDAPSSLQESSLATEPAVWLGVTESRAHLTQDMVRALLPALEHFAQTGRLPRPVVAEEQGR